MKSTYKVILSRGDTVGGKQVQHDKVRDCHATLAMTRGEQSGRSMVEMLGVLAVIGLLSVAGIAGYSIAMRSYRTNEIVNAASMLHILAMAQNAGNGPNTNVGYTDVGGNANPSGVSALEYNKDTKAISITFTDPDDCTMAANKLGDKATADCANKKITVNFGEAGTVNTQKETEETCTSKIKSWVTTNENCYDTYDDASDYCANNGYAGYSGNEEGGTSGFCV